MGIGNTYATLYPNYKYDNLQTTLEILKSSNSTGAYVFTANPLTPDPTVIEQPANNLSTFTNTYSNMVFGKRINPDDASIGIRRFDWVSNTVYTMYDDQANLSNTNFYCVSQQNQNYYVFKCLDNNFESPSTQQPLYNETSVDDPHYELSDGYVWKYMYTLSSDQYNKFTTANFIALSDNSNVQVSAVNGSIDVIKVESNGQFFDNYDAGQFMVTDIRVNGDSTCFRLSNTASSVNNFYQNCMLVITEGTGKGEFRKITSYIGSSRCAYVNSAFTSVIDTTSYFEVSPAVNIIGDGYQTVNCEARALVNSISSNCLYRVEILNHGKGYRFAFANVATTPVLPIANSASLRPIMSPPGGHGANGQAELFGAFLITSVSFQNSESNSISTSNDYRTVGIIMNPEWNFITCDLLDSKGNVGSDGNFTASEKVFQYLPVKISGTVSINAASRQITSSSGGLSNFLDSNDVIIITTSTGSYQPFIVNTVSNTSIITTSNSLYTDSNATITKCVLTGQALVNAVPLGQLILGSVQGIIRDGNHLIGMTSFAHATVNSYTISDQTKNFQTYQQLTRYNGQLASGSFTQNEIIVDEGASAQSYFHSLETPINSSYSILYAYDGFGVFQIGDTIVGSNSDAHFTIQNKYTGDLVPNSGHILYLENLSPVYRSNSQTETIKLVIEY